MLEPPRIYRLSALRRDVQERARIWIAGCASAGWPVRVIETARTEARQDWLYGSGRPDFPRYGRPGPILTHLDGRDPRARHVAAPGHATGFDYLFVRPLSMSDSDYAAWVWNRAGPPWALAGALGAALGFTWGGAWQMLDLGHLEID